MGDRHLKFHADRDNLRNCSATVLLFVPSAQANTIFERNASASLSVNLS